MKIKSAGPTALLVLAAGRCLWKDEVLGGGACAGCCSQAESMEGGKSYSTSDPRTLLLNKPGFVKVKEAGQRDSLSCCCFP
jgi:hypothetical protein